MEDEIRIKTMFKKREKTKENRKPAKKKNARGDVESHNVLYKAAEYTRCTGESRGISKKNGEKTIIMTKKKRYHVLRLYCCSWW